MGITPQKERTARVIGSEIRDREERMEWNERHGAGRPEFIRRNEQLADEIKKLREELERTRNDATLQKQSFMGGGFGGLIQQASLGGFRGGMGIRGGVGGLAGISPGVAGGGLALPGGAAAGPLRERISTAKRAFMDQLRKEGVPAGNLEEAANLLAGQAIAESKLNPRAIHDAGTGYGIYGARDPKGWGSGRRTAMIRSLEANGFARDSLEGQARFMAREAMTDPRYRATRNALMNANPANREGNTNTITRNFEAPAVVNRRSGDVSTAAGVNAGDEMVSKSRGGPQEVKGSASLDITLNGSRLATAPAPRWTGYSARSTSTAASRCRPRRTEAMCNNAQTGEVPTGP